MSCKNSSPARRRLRIALLGTSLGLVATAGVAQETGNDIGGAISNAIGNQIRGSAGGQGTLNPVDRGVGAAVRGVIEGQDVGDAVQRGLNESTQTLGETPYQTRQRDWNDSGRPGYAPNDYAPNGYAPNGYGQNYNDPRNPGYGLNQSRVNQGFNTNQGYNDGQGRVVTRINTQGEPYQVRISGTQGARLGISMQENQQGILVSNVTRGSAAANAGIRTGDVLVNVDGQRVVNTQQVAQAIGQRNPGDDVSLVVLRNGQRQQLNATLQGFAAADETQRMARPALDEDGSTEQMQQQIRDLQNQIRDLQNQLRAAQSGGAAADAAGAGDASGAAVGDASAAGAEADAELDVDASASPDAAGVQLRGAADLRSGAQSDGDAALGGDAAADVSLDSARTGLSGRAATTNPSAND